MKRGRCHAIGVRQERHEAGIQIAGPRAHHQSGRRREAHARIDARAAFHRRQARAVAQVREDDAPPGRFPSRGTLELFHQVGVRQTVEAVSPDSFLLVPARNRQEPGHDRHPAVKRGVEARHLRQPRTPIADQLDQRGFAGQMIRRIRHGTMQLGEDSVGDMRGRRPRKAVNDPMSDGARGGEYSPRLEPVDEDGESRIRVPRLHALCGARLAARRP
jgi:hypothetical protein